jgi:carboxylesterase
MLSILLLALFSIAALAVAILWFAPMGSFPLVAQASAAPGFEDSLARIAQIQARDGDDINPLCRTFALTHDAPTERAIALFHGMSNCPAQWRMFAEMLFAAGYNVYVPRIPHNGYANRVDERAAELTVDDLVLYGTEAVDILQGLGEHTTVMGLSAGGVVSAWAAMNRSDVDRAIIIAPSLLPGDVAAWAARPAVNFMRFIPNQPYWWDAELKEKIVGPPYAAPLAFSRQAGEVFRMGQMLLDQAALTAPAMPVVFVSNESDTAINAQLVDELRSRWERGGTTVETFTFPAALGVNHDIIDPHQQTQRIDVIYPQLFRLVTGEVYAGEIPTVK